MSIDFKKESPHQNEYGDLKCSQLKNIKLRNKSSKEKDIFIFNHLIDNLFIIKNYRNAIVHGDNLFLNKKHIGEIKKFLLVKKDNMRNETTEKAILEKNQNSKYFRLF